MSSEAEASLSLIVARIVYGVNWFNISSVFPLIVMEFSGDVSLLGSITASFFIGIGLFQIPSGIFAARFNPGISAILGITVASAAALLSGLASSPLELILLRFIVGLGMAFFFSSAVILIARYGKRGSPGFSIGIMNSAHSMGGIIGIFGWIIIAQIVGWRLSLIMSGVLGLGTALFMIITIPDIKKIKISDSGKKNNKIDYYPYQPIEKEQKFKIIKVLRILSNRTLIYLGVVLIGIQSAWAAELTFIVVYLRSLGFSSEFVGVIASLPLILSIFSAPLIGRLYDKTRDISKMLFICGVGTSLAIAGLSVHSLYLIIVSAVLTGFFSGGAFTVVYEKARTASADGELTTTKNRDKQISCTDKSNSNNINNRLSSNSSYFDTLRIAWVNGLSLVGVLWTPIAFSYIVKEASYDQAWIFSAAVTALFVITPIKFLK
ncbi:MAG: MFS transporter [Thermoproteota archaeon]|nr:MFS transporter [Thermoproteota archaeon]